jgi:tetratricopeptide (TPR) repeat protein
MKKVNVWNLNILFLSATMLIACDDKDKEEESARSIVVNNPNALSQSIYANDTQGENGVTFTTNGAWTSTIAVRNTSAADWISIKPDHGNSAGEYTIYIELEPNETEADRTATITIICNGQEEFIIITQMKMNMLPVTMIPLDELFAIGRPILQRVYNAWQDIDTLYSTLTARQRINVMDGALLDFWGKSYNAIECYNLLLERSETDNDITEATRVHYKGIALAYRAAVYFYLKTLFGGVPLHTDGEMIFIDIPRASEQEIDNFILSSLEEALQLLPLQVADSVRLMSAIHALQINDVAKAQAALDEILSRNTSIKDINGDGRIDAVDYPHNTLFARACLLSAEIALYSGNATKAIESVNRIYAIPGLTAPLAIESTPEQIMDAIRNEFTHCNSGMWYLNSVRWGLTSTWSYHTLLPIPGKAMQDNRLLVQNPGYELYLR